MPWVLFRRMKNAIEDFIGCVRIARPGPLLPPLASESLGSDAYGEEGRSRTRVFISYERESASLATSFKDSCYRYNLAAFAYTPVPSSDTRLVDKATLTKLEQLDRFQSTAPDAARELEATLRRTHWFIFLVTERSVLSGACELEGFGAFFAPLSSVESAPVVVVKDRADLEAPVFLQKFSTYVYKRGLEDQIARAIAVRVQAIDPLDKTQRRGLTSRSS